MLGGLAASRGPTVEEKKSATIGLELAARPEALRYFFWMSIRYLALIIHLLRLLMGAHVGIISNRRTVHRQLPEETHGRRGTAWRFCARYISPSATLFEDFGPHLGIVGFREEWGLGGLRRMGILRNSYILEVGSLLRVIVDEGD